MKTSRFASLLALAGCATVTSVHAEVSFVHGVALPNGGEIISFANGTLAVTDSLDGTSHGAQLYSLAGSGQLSAGVRANLDSALGTTAAGISAISSVLADARGFGVATVIPKAGATTTPGELGSLGRIAFFDLSTGNLLQTLEVGYHPDSVTITPDGSKLLIANEGEFISVAVDTTAGNARPGSISVVNISSITGGAGLATQVGALTSSHVATYDFQAANLDTGVTLADVRNNRLDTLTVKTPDYRDVEPEYIAATNDKAYVTLQEGNAIATLDLGTGKYTTINSLGTITKVVDASDQDGGININDTVTGMPMPDTMVKFQRSGTTYLVTANEGDARPDDGDIGRAGSGAVSALIDTVNGGGADQVFTGSLNSATGIGRLNVVKDVGDTDGDGLIENPTMLGTRSFSIWNATTGALVFDSGSMIEQFVATNNSASFNINSGNTANVDTRSDDKGPEPEALAFGSIDGRDFVFVGNERENGIFQFDITDLENVFIAGYFNPITGMTDGTDGGAYISPESMTFVAAGAAGNTTGKNLLIVGFEGTGGNGSIGVFEVTATSAIPEPSTAAALAGLAMLGLAGVRRRRRA